MMDAAAYILSIVAISLSIVALVGQHEHRRSHNERVERVVRDIDQRDAVAFASEMACTE